MKNYLCLFFCFSLSTIHAQTENLIKNPGFELYKKLPEGTSQWDRMEYWENPQDKMKNPGSPDFYHMDSKGQNSRLPSPAWIDGIEIFPKEGKAVAGIIGCSNNNLHEYISIALARKIKVGEKIKISFYYTNGKGTAVGKRMTKLGTYFSVNQPSINVELMEVTPQTEMATPMFNNDWALYEGEFTATEEFQYMTIGGFHGPDNKNLQDGTENALFNDWAYYFIDGVEVKNIGSGDLPISEKTSDGLKFIFKSKDNLTLLRVKGEILINDDLHKDLFDDSVYVLSEKIPSKIKLTASASGYFTYTETLKGNTIPVANSIRIINLKPIKKGATIVLENILFDSGSPILLPSSHEELNALIKFLNENSTMEILISGHTDNRGNPEIDLELSKKRAINVMNYLIQNGISAKRITAKGYGMTKPIADNHTDEGRAKNRRVEFSVK